MNLTPNVVKEIAKTAAAEIMEQLGCPTLLTFSQAKAKYGTLFTDMVKQGLVKPSYIGKGKNGIRKYSVQDILAVKASEMSKATLMFK